MSYFSEPPRDSRAWPLADSKAALILLPALAIALVMGVLYFVISSGPDTTRATSPAGRSTTEVEFEETAEPRPTFTVRRPETASTSTRPTPSPSPSVKTKQPVRPTPTREPEPTPTVTAEPTPTPTTPAPTPTPTTAEPSPTSPPPSLPADHGGHGA